MSEQMREEFEAWAIKKATESKYPYMHRLLDRTDDDYATTWVDSAWMGWRASRESQPTGYTAIDMGTAAADGRRSLAEYLIKQIAIEHPDQETLLTVKYIAQWIALEAGL